MERRKFTDAIGLLIAVSLMVGWAVVSCTPSENTKKMAYNECVKKGFTLGTQSFSSCYTNLVITIHKNKNPGPSFLFVTNPPSPEPVEPKPNKPEWANDPFFGTPTEPAGAPLHRVD